jgi:hypothetical protein
MQKAAGRDALRLTAVLRVGAARRDAFALSHGMVAGPIRSSCSVSGMPLWLDPKGRKDQGGEEIGYLRSISAKIFETRSVPAVRRSDSEDF